MVKGVYKITNDRTGEVYIGQAVNLDSRKNRHLRELAQGKHHNTGMQKDHDRGDTFSFEILEELPDATKADLLNKESQYIKKYNCFREGYNQTPGGAMDQFQGRYEYGGGRLPIEKYQPTDKYLNKNIVYCPECGTQLELEDTYCSNCGKKIDRSAIDLKDRNAEEKIAINENDNSISRNKDIISIIIVLCMLLIFLIYLNNNYGFSVILFFINIIGNVILFFVFMGILFLLCGKILDS